MEGLLDALASSLAREDSIAPEQIGVQLRANSLSVWTEKQILKASVKVTKKYRLREQFGRLRAALLVGTTTCGRDFVTKAERAGALLSDEMPAPKFDTFLTNLRSEADAGGTPDWSFLRERLDTYLVYRQLVAALAGSEAEILPLLRDGPRDRVKKVLALTHLHFLRHKFQIGGQTEEWLDRFGPPEEVASIASILVVRANEYRSLDSWDFAFPLSTELATADVRKLMEYGNGICKQHEAAKDISYFGYRLELSPASTGQKVFRLCPPSLEFEYARRLGFIRSEMGLSKIPLEMSSLGPVPQFSLQVAAEMFVARAREMVQDIRDDKTPFRRVRVRYPASAKIYNALMHTGFYEDFADRERFSQDFLVPLLREGEKEIPLTDKLDLQSFLRLWRLLQFLCLVDIYVLQPFEKTDLTILCNSLIRVAKETDLIQLITSAGIEEEKAHEFLRLVSADAQKLGYFDVQYRPFLRIAPATQDGATNPPEIIYLSGLVASGNALRNVQSANQLRLAANADMFVEAVAGILGTRFKRVATNRRVELPAGETDVDVLVLEGKELYLFECKHSLPPTDPHEMRDIWEDIEKGVSQLERAQGALKDPGRLLNYLRNWFPGISRQEMSEIQLIPCVLCSHRIFAGMNHKGIPIRDFSSLAKLLDDGVVGLGVVENDESIMSRFRLIAENGFSSEDLDNYVGSESRFFRIFARFMFPISRFDRFVGITFARETYVYGVELGAWLRHMTALGFERLPDERKKWTIPWSPEEILAKDGGPTDANVQ